jgi:hypothetical protein
MFQFDFTLGKTTESHPRPDTDRMAIDCGDDPFQNRLFPARLC